MGGSNFGYTGNWFGILAFFQEQDLRKDWRAVSD